MAVIYAFAFPCLRTILYDLHHINSSYIIYPNNINHYLKILDADRPQYVLGLGRYTGRDKDRIRIETLCNNRYGKSFIEGDSYCTKEMKPYISPNGDFKYAYSLGYSWCNYISWKITELINSKRLVMKYTFLHVPKSFKSQYATEIINESIKNLV